MKCIVMDFVIQRLPFLVKLRGTPSSTARFASGRMSDFVKNGAGRISSPLFGLPRARAMDEKEKRENDKGIIEIIEIPGLGLRMPHGKHGGSLRAQRDRQRATPFERAPEALRTIAARCYEFWKTLPSPAKACRRPFVPLSPASLGNPTDGSSKIQ